MKTNRDEIIEKAFAEYLQLGYSGVSISVLQKKLHIGRASLYYYFATKESLFDAILNRYFVEPIEAAFAKINQIKPLLITDVIDGLVEVYAQLHKNIVERNPEANMQNMMSLLMYAYMNNADFLRIKSRQVHRLWVKAIRNSIAAGLVRPDIHIEMVAYIFSGIKSAYEMGLTYNQEDISFLRESYNYQYSLIRRDESSQP